MEKKRVRKSEVGSSKVGKSESQEARSQNSKEHSPINTPQSEIKEPLTTHNSPLTKPMEVHHHPEVEKKGFKEYLLEGLMIFVAVTMGFFAESLREHIADHDKEAQYVRSMIQDAATDTVNINSAIKMDETKVKQLDSLANNCFNDNPAPGNDSLIYKLFRRSIAAVPAVTPTERTMTQLNTGGMRLVTNKAAVDSMVVYNAHGKILTNQFESYQLFRNKLVDVAITVLNWKYIPATRLRVHYSYYGAQLLVRDRMKVIQLGNTAKLMDGVMLLYVVRLQEQKQHAITLINTLKKQYSLGDE